MFKLLTSRSKTSKKGLIPNPPQNNNNNQSHYHSGNNGMNYPMHNDVNRGLPPANGYRNNHNKPLPPSPHYPPRQGQSQYHDYPQQKPQSIQSHIQNHQSHIHSKHNQNQYQGPPQSYQHYQNPNQHQGHPGYSGQPQVVPSGKAQSRVPPLRSNNLQYTQFSSSSATAAKMDQRNAPRQNTPLQKLLIPPIEIDSDQRYYYDQASPTRYSDPISPIRYNDPISPSRYEPMSPSPLRSDDHRDYDRRRPTSHYQLRHQPDKVVEQDHSRDHLYRSKNISVPNDLGGRYRRDGRVEGPSAAPVHQERAHSLYSPISRESHQDSDRDSHYEDSRDVSRQVSRETPRNYSRFDSQDVLSKAPQAKTRDMRLDSPTDPTHFYRRDNRVESNQDSRFVRPGMTRPQNTENITRESHVDNFKDSLPPPPVKSPLGHNASDFELDNKNEGPLRRASRALPTRPLPFPTQRIHSESILHTLSSNSSHQDLKNDGSENLGSSPPDSRNQNDHNFPAEKFTSQPMRPSQSTPADLARAPPRWKFLEELRKDGALQAETLKNQLRQFSQTPDDVSQEVNEKEATPSKEPEKLQEVAAEPIKNDNTSSKEEHVRPEEFSDYKVNGSSTLGRFHKAAEVQKQQRSSIKTKSKSSTDPPSSAAVFSETLSKFKHPTIDQTESQINLTSNEASKPVEMDHRTYFQADPQLRTLLSKEVAKDKNQDVDEESSSSSSYITSQKSTQEKIDDLIKSAVPSETLTSPSRITRDRSLLRTASGLIQKNAMKMLNLPKSPDSTTLPDPLSSKSNQSSVRNKVSKPEVSLDLPKTKRVSRKESKSKFLSTKRWNKSSSGEEEKVSNETGFQLQNDSKSDCSNSLPTTKPPKESRSVKKFNKKSAETSSNSDADITVGKDRPKTVVENLRNKFEMKIQEAAGVSSASKKDIAALRKSTANMKQRKTTQSMGNLRLLDPDNKLNLTNGKEITPTVSLPSDANDADKTSKLALAWKASALSRASPEGNTPPFPESIKNTLLKSPPQISPTTARRTSGVWSFNTITQSLSSLRPLSPTPVENNDEPLSSPLGMAFQLELSEVRLQMEMWRKKLREEQLSKANLEQDYQDRLDRLNDIHSTETNSIKKLCSHRIRELIYVIRELQTLNALYRAQMNRFDIVIPSAGVDVESLMKEPAIEPVFSPPTKSVSPQTSENDIESESETKRSSPFNNPEIMNDSKLSPSIKSMHSSQSPDSSAPAGSLTPLTMYKFIEDQYRQIVQDDDKPPVALKMAKSVSAPPDPIEYNMPSLSPDQKATTTSRSHNDARITQLLSSIERTAAAIVEMDATRHTRSSSAAHQGAEFSAQSKTADSFYNNRLAHRSHPNFSTTNNEDSKNQKPTQKATNFRKHYASNNDLHYENQQTALNDSVNDPSKDLDSSTQINIRSRLAPSLSSLNLSLNQSPPLNNKQLHSAKDYPIDLSGIDASLKAVPVEILPESVPSTTRAAYHSYSQNLPRVQLKGPAHPLNNSVKSYTSTDSERFSRDLNKPLPRVPLFP